MSEEAASRMPGMRFSFGGVEKVAVEKVAGTGNTKTTATVRHRQGEGPRGERPSGIGV